MGAWLNGRLTRIVVLLVALESAAMIALQYRQHVNYGTYGYDVGLYDQATWLLGRGPFSSPFLTSRGLPVWGHHVNPILIALSPLTRLGAGVMWFSSMQTILVFLGAVPVAWLTRSKTGSAEAGLAMAVVYLLYPANIFFAFFYFHPEVLAPLPMLLMAWFAHRRRFVPMWLSAVLALACREEVSIAIGGFGVVLLVEALRNRDCRLALHALAVAAVSGAWFIICARIIIPGALGGQPFYLGTFYGRYGDSYGEIAKNLLTDPALSRGLISSGHRSTFLVDLLAPLGFLPLLGVPVLMSAGPLLGLLMSSNEHSQSIQSHYPAILIAGIFLGAIEAVRWLWPRRVGRVALTVMVALSVGTSILRSPAPWSVNRIWKTAEPRRDVFDRAIRMIPDDASVSAMGNLVPHLSHRSAIYQFPNPIVRWFYGEFALGDPSGTEAPQARNGSSVDWILVERGALGRFESDFDLLIQDRTFEVVFEEDGVMLARRVAGDR